MESPPLTGISYGSPARGAAGLITSFSGYTGDNSGTRWLPGDLAAYKGGTAFTSSKGGGV